MLKCDSQSSHSWDWIGRATGYVMSEDISCHKIYNVTAYVMKKDLFRDKIYYVTEYVMGNDISVTGYIL